MITTVQFWIGFIVGILFGGFAALMILALCSAAGRADDYLYIQVWALRAHKYHGILKRLWANRSAIETVGISPDLWLEIGAVFTEPSQ